MHASISSKRERGGVFCVCKREEITGTDRGISPSMSMCMCMCMDVDVDVDR